MLHPPWKDFAVKSFCFIVTHQFFLCKTTEQRLFPVDLYSETGQAQSFYAKLQK